MAVAKFGEKLRRERESRRITLDQIAEATKISSRNLRALEEENFAILPGGIFNKGFVRSYARFLGINEDKAVADYLAAAGEKLPAAKIEGGGIPDPPPKPRKPESSKGAPSGAFWITATVLLGVALGLGGWKYYKQYLTERSARAARTVKVEATTPTLTLPTEPAPVEGVSTIADATQQGSLTPASVPTQPVPENQATAPAKISLVLQVSVNQDSWMRLTVDGSLAVEEVLKAGTVRSFRGVREIIVVAGNAGGVDLSLNGHKLDPLGPEGVRGERTFTAED
jgi:cytoskeleton protein RodZ